MKKYAVHVLAVLFAALPYAMTFATTEFRTLTSLEQGGPLHYRLPYPHRAWWFDDTDPCQDCTPDWDWNIYNWAGYYNRSGSKAFFNPCEDDVTRKKENLSVLFFGQENFSLSNLVSGGIVNCQTAQSTGAALNPFAILGLISPRIAYSENGVNFGMYAEHAMGCNRNWRIGGRANIPFVVISVDQLEGCCTESSSFSNLISETPLNLDMDADSYSYDYAYNLSFLSCLTIPALPPSNSLPVMQYGDGTDINKTMVSGVISSATAAEVDGQNVPPVFLIKRTDDTLPPRTPFWTKTRAGVVPLPADGSGANNEVFYFDTNTNYKTNFINNPTLQNQFFVVPHLYDTQLDIADEATTIRSSVDALLAGINEMAVTPLAFFQSIGIDLDRSERFTGLGDLNTQIFGGYSAEDYCYFLFGVFGVRWPTGTRNNDPQRIFFQSTGHNGHYEVNGGFEAGWRPWEWLAFSLDFIANHVISRRQNLPAPFCGATVKGIGPCAPAEVSWNYYTAHAGFTLFHPCNSELGCAFNYEFFGKQKDRVKFCEDTATDFVGTVGMLNPELYTNRTDVIAHKVRGEIFHRWNLFEIFGGGSQVVAGRNAMQETEIHLGLSIYF